MEETAFTGTGQNPRITCPEGSLLPGQSKTCTADYTVTEEDIRKGSVRNTVTASGTPSGGPPGDLAPVERRSDDVPRSRPPRRTPQAGSPAPRPRRAPKPHDPHSRPGGPHGDGHHEKRPRQTA
ncbi:hypothetical protein ACIOWI_24370 [Streptomyces sp. NPDC087659]|uniref:DUF7507 domain-containing protein n=1 Tax=Streptomyces sp. NPDC087659 TaxID=3365801 RepID=UPI0037F7CE1C